MREGKVATVNKRKASARVPGDNALRVLIVDDSHDVADSLALVLALCGHHVLKAYDARTALELAAEHPPDAVILDLLLPDMDGYLLAQAFRNDPRWRNVVLIAYTGDGTAAARERCAAAGIDVYVLKPVDPEHLVDIVTQFKMSAPPPAQGLRLYGVNQ